MTWPKILHAVSHFQNESEPDKIGMIRSKLLFAWIVFLIVLVIRVQSSVDTFFADKMRQYLVEMERQVDLNKKAYLSTAKKFNLVTSLSTFIDMTGVLLSIVLTDYSRSLSEPAVLVRAIGRPVELGSYDAESLLTLKELDVSCARKFRGLVRKFDIDGAISALETHLNGNKSIIENDVHRIEMDLEDFDNEFKTQLSCVLSGDISTESRKLLGLLDLYDRAAKARLKRLMS